MTILAGARSRSAVVLGADSQETVGGLRRNTVKLVRPQPGLVIGWAGYKDIAQAMQLSLQEAPLDLTQARSLVATSARKRFGTIRSDPDIEHRSDFNEFMLAWYCSAERKPVGIRLPSQGSAVWIEQWEYVGNQSALTIARAVEASIGYVQIDTLVAEQLSLVVLKVLRDSVEIAPPSAGIGGDVQLATITENGVHILDATDRRTANDALDVWQERCAELLPGARTRRPEDEARDRGLRPPE